MCVIGLSLVGDFFGFQHAPTAEIIDFDSEFTQIRNMNLSITDVLNFDAPITMVYDFDGEYK